MMYCDPFYRITYLIKEEIRKYKWIEGEKGRTLSWQQARAEWTEAHREEYEKFLLDTLPSADSVTGELSTETENQPQGVEDSAEAQEDIARTGAMLSKLPPRAGG
jgi:hypothetical protein